MDAEYIGTRQSEATTIESCDQEESCVTDVQTSDGEMYYGVFSDDESSESNEVDYETDLEVDEESKFKLCGNTPYTRDATFLLISQIRNNLTRRVREWIVVS